jgi:hypothetical protein
VGGGEVHPELEAVHAAAVAQDLRRRHLAVHDPGPRRHPLHAAALDQAAVALAVLVLHGPFQQVGHRLEAAVWVVRRADGLTRCVVDRAQLVEEQERVEARDPLAGERAPDHEAPSLQLLMRGDDQPHSTDVLGHLSAR